MARCGPMLSSASEIRTFLQPESPTVQPQWLMAHLDKVKVLDASWYMPAERRDPWQEFQDSRVDGAQFFDIDGISDPNSHLPHMLPSSLAFSIAASHLGLSNSDQIVLYDGKGIFSAARAWWMFRAFSHSSVWVLDGGLPLYRSLGGRLNSDALVGAQSVERAKTAVAAAKAAVSKPESEKVKLELTFKAQLEPKLIRSMSEIQEHVAAKSATIIDARSEGRFSGKEAEPRKGLRSGHIPHSINVPFTRVLTAQGTLKEDAELRDVFQDAGLSFEKPVVTTCGTGVTAAILALALHRLKYPDVAVYDGSWTEWGRESSGTAVVTS